MKRVLLVVNEFPPGPGGIGTHALALASQLWQLGYHVAVACEQNYVSDSEVKRFSDSMPFEVNSLSNSRWPKLFNQFLRVNGLIRKGRYDVVIASGSSSLWLMAVCRLWYGFNFFAVVHGGELNFTEFLRRWLTRLSILSAEKVICVSHYTRGLLPKGIPEERVEVIHNGADDRQFNPVGKLPELVSRLGIEGKIVLLTVGSVTERKAQDTVIRALPTIRAHFPNVVYLVAGKPQEVEQFEQLASSMNVSGQVMFLGQVSQEDLNGLYNVTDVYVLTSRHSKHGDFEGFGISVIEAALCKVPAVVTSNSGLTEAVEAGYTGLVVDADDPQKTADAIISLLSDEAMRLRFGENARERALRLFTWSSSIGKYHNLIERL